MVDPVYLGGPLNSQVIFALVEGKQGPGGESFELMPGLHAAVDADTVDRIIRTESDHARFVAGLVVWRHGELRAEIERGAWYVLPPDRTSRCASRARACGKSWSASRNCARTASSL